MANLINAKCPNCGAILELPSKLDRAFCIHCGGKVIIAKDVHVAKTAIACPECKGLGYHPCPNCDGKGICNWTISIQKILLKLNYKDIAAHSNPSYLAAKCINGKCSRCNGTGKISVWKRTFYIDKGGECHACDSTGICPQCNGTGKCNCKGTGKIKCEVCNGTGFKVYQGE